MDRETFEAAVQERLAALAAADFTERLWAADPTLWKADDEAHQKIIGNALGWLSVFEGVRDEVHGLTEFVHELSAEQDREAVALGLHVVREFREPCDLVAHALEHAEPAEGVADHLLVRRVVGLPQRRVGLPEPRREVLLRQRGDPVVDRPQELGAPVASLTASAPILARRHLSHRPRPEGPGACVPRWRPSPRRTP